MSKDVNLAVEVSQNPHQYPNIMCQIAQQVLQYRAEHQQVVQALHGPLRTIRRRWNQLLHTGPENWFRRCRTAAQQLQLESNDAECHAFFTARRQLYDNRHKIRYSARRLAGLNWCLQHPDPSKLYHMFRDVEYLEDSDVPSFQKHPQLADPKAAEVLAYRLMMSAGRASKR